MRKSDQLCRVKKEKSQKRLQIQKYLRLFESVDGEIVVCFFEN
jgi:hypothetical protein